MSIPAAQVDAVVEAAITGLKLPDNWQAAALESLPDSDRAAARISEERANIERRLERARRALLDGDIEPEVYRAERARLEADLARLAPPTTVGSAEAVADLLADLPRLWTEASPERRRELAEEVIAEIRCDLDQPAVLKVVLAPLPEPLERALPMGVIQRVTDGA